VIYGVKGSRQVVDESNKKLGKSFLLT